MNIFFNFYNKNLFIKKIYRNIVERILLTLQQAAKLLGYSPQTIQKYKKQKLIKVFICPIAKSQGKIR